MQTFVDIFYKTTVRCHNEYIPKSYLWGLWKSFVPVKICTPERLLDTQRVEAAILLFSTLVISLCSIIFIYIRWNRVEKHVTFNNQDTIIELDYKRAENRNKHYRKNMRTNKMFKKRHKTYASEPLNDYISFLREHGLVETFQQHLQQISDSNSMSWKTLIQLPADWQIAYAFERWTPEAYRSLFAKPLELAIWHKQKGTIEFLQVIGQKKKFILYLNKTEL